MKKPLRTKLQVQTRASVIQHVLDSLDRASRDDEGEDSIYSAVECMKGADVAECDVASIVADRRLQAAFRKFVRLAISGFEFVAEDFRPASDCPHCR
jgi:hypothetical protein